MSEDEDEHDEAIAAINERWRRDHLDARAALHRAHMAADERRRMALDALRVEV